MIVLRFCALFAMLAPVSLLATTLCHGDGPFIVSTAYFLGLVSSEIAAIATLVVAWKRRRQPERCWPDLTATVSAVLSVFAPVPALAFFVTWIGGGPQVGWLVFVPIIVLAVGILRAPSTEDSYIPLARKRAIAASRIVSAADVLRRRALGRNHGLEGRS